MQTGTRNDLAALGTTDHVAGALTRLYNSEHYLFDENSFCLHPVPVHCLEVQCLLELQLIFSLLVA
jgi:hypothetical protein